MASRQKIFGVMGAVLLSLAAAGGTAWAADYYMSPSGNDSNPGTLAAPWKTMDKVHEARKTLRPGDTVYFRGGDYVITDANRSYYVLGGNGSASAPVTYKNYNAEKPVIIYDRTTADNTTTGSANMIFAQKYTVIDGLNFKQTERSRLQGMNGNALVERGGRKTAITVYGSGVTIRNCSIDNFSSIGVGYFGGENLLVEHCRFTNNGAHTFYIGSKNGTFRYNFMDGSRGYPIQYNIQIQYETAIGNKIYGNLVMNGQAGNTVFSGSVANNEVFNNIMINGGSKTDGSFGYALHFWCERNHGGSPATARSGNKFYNNTIIGKSNTGLIDTRLGTPEGGKYCQSMNGGRPLAENIQIYNNIFYPSSPPAQTLTPISTIRNNIFYNIKGSVPPGNILINPMLANSGGTTSADAMLTAGSPAIDKAISPFPINDYQGGKRPFGAAADIGAFEFGAPPGQEAGPLGGGGISFPPSAPVFLSPTGEICPSPYL